MIFKKIYSIMSKQNKLLEEWEQIPLFLSIKGGYTLASIEQRVEELLEPIINNIGYKLYDVEYAKEAKNYFLRIFIDKAEGAIDLDDCERVNNAITDILDETDYIKDQYFLEVSSSGIEKIIRKDNQLKDNIGTNIEIRLFKPINGERIYQGILKDFNNDEIIIESETITNIPRKNISLIKTVYEW